ncbi:hypothetical protein AC579_7757 [Pseudocercospora musae]|uniref:Uncharacterized protein n=1 Tax=Pseudocercospora musae TaxID=113226 RepID=A0A139IKF2_9PEZI|nr:hypothetical protein AC579_7757 [Pseudocercospora musae]
MVSSKSVLITIATAAGLLQMCPAPQAVVAAIAGGVAAGVIGGGASICTKYCPDAKIKARQAMAFTQLVRRQLPPGVSQESIDQCTQQLNDQFNNGGGSVEITDSGETSVLVSNVPPACMNLATILTGNPSQAGGPVPVPMSSNSLEYQGLTVEDRQNLSAALQVS